MKKSCITAYRSSEWKGFLEDDDPRTEVMASSTAKGAAPAKKQKSNVYAGGDQLIRDTLSNMAETKLDEYISRQRVNLAYIAPKLRDKLRANLKHYEDEKERRKKCQLKDQDHEDFARNPQTGASNGPKEEDATSGFKHIFAREHKDCDDSETVEAIKTTPLQQAPIKVTRRMSLKPTKKRSLLNVEVAVAKKAKVQSMVQEEKSSEGANPVVPTASNVIEKLMASKARVTERPVSTAGPEEESVWPSPGQVEDSFDNDKYLAAEVQKKAPQSKAGSKGMTVGPTAPQTSALLSNQGLHDKDFPSHMYKEWFQVGRNLPLITEEVYESFKQRGLVTKNDEFFYHVSKVIPSLCALGLKAEELFGPIDIELLKNKLAESQAELNDAKRDLEAQKKLTCQEEKRADKQLEALKQEGKQREEAESSLQQVRAELELKEKENVDLRDNINTFKTEVSYLETIMKCLQDQLSTARAQAIEDFCMQEGPLLKISDAFSSGFFLCQKQAYGICEKDSPNQAAKIISLEVPSEIDLPPGLVDKVLEKRSDAVSMLQYLRKENPDTLAKWEAGIPFPKSNDEDQH